MKNRKGVAVMVVLFFCFAIATVLYVLISSNVNLAYQNRKTLLQLQAYYMAHSGLQHAKLKLRLLPKETFDVFSGGGNFPVKDLDSSLQGVLNVSCALGDKFTLFDDAVQILPTDSPYQGRYWVESGDIRLSSSHKSMALVQDGYQIKVNGTVVAGMKKEGAETIEEEVIVSRFSGGS